MNPSCQPLRKDHRLRVAAGASFIEFHPWSARRNRYQMRCDKLVWKKPEMGKARLHTPEQVENVLRQIEVAGTNGKTHLIASREVGITRQLVTTSRPGGGLPLLLSRMRYS